MATYDQFIAALETFLLSNVGVTTMRHPDGRQVTYDRKQALAELNYWQNKKTMQTNSGLTFSRFGLVGDN